MDFATPLHHLVLEKQRRDPEVVSAPRHQLREVPQSIKVIRRLRALDEAEPISEVWERTSATAVAATFSGVRSRRARG